MPAGQRLPPADSIRLGQTQSGQPTSAGRPRGPSVGRPAAGGAGGRRQVRRGPNGFGPPVRRAAGRASRARPTGRFPLAAASPATRPAIVAAAPAPPERRRRRRAPGRSRPLPRSPSGTSRDASSNRRCNSWISRSFSAMIFSVVWSTSSIFSRSARWSESFSSKSDSRAARMRRFSASQSRPPPCSRALFGEQPRQRTGLWQVAAEARHFRPLDRAGRPDGHFVAAPIVVAGSGSARTRSPVSVVGSRAGSSSRTSCLRGRLRPVPAVPAARQGIRRAVALGLERRGDCSAQVFSPGSGWSDVSMNPIRRSVCRCAVRRCARQNLAEPIGA